MAKPAFKNAFRCVFDDEDDDDDDDDDGDDDDGDDDELISCQILSPFSAFRSPISWSIPARIISKMTPLDRTM